MKVYCFAEPHITGGSALVEITEKQIRTWMKKTYPMIKKAHQIEEFCVLHWAWEKTKNETPR
jgi:hypothetical protein